MKKTLFSILFVGLLIVGVFYVKNEENKVIQEDKTQNNDFSCIRDTRLNNAPHIDRALSIIGETYEGWDTDSENDWNSFPPRLVNCIKIIEDKTRDTEEAEAYFIFGDDEIRENYFPIYVDKDYRYTDDLLISLLLVHEITHVRQYLDVMRGQPQLSCIDKESEAFHASWTFGRFQNAENRKSLSLRMEYDEDLHPVLRIINDLNKTVYSGVFRRLSGEGGICEDTSKDCSKLITQYHRNIIKTVISQEGYYKEQCDL